MADVPGARGENVDRRDARDTWLLSAPALVILTFAAAGPLLVMLVYSFLTPGEYGNVVWRFSTDPWVSTVLTRDIFDGTYAFADAHLAILWRSVKLALTTTVLTFVLGLPTAWFIATRPARLRATLLFLIMIPFWTNLLIRTFAITQIIRNEGILNTFLRRVGVIEEPLVIIYSDFAVLLGMTYVYLPLMVLPLFAAIDRFDLRLIEAAYDLYASRWQVLRHVAMPIIRPGIVAGAILVFIPSLGAYVTPRILGGGRHMMIGNFIELQFGQGRNWPLGAALSVLLLVFVGAALILLLRTTTRTPADG
ncbi:ABC transporter permease [Amaricoccus sp.]|uniref:ABC transporter permease n=1 Tax=Amaricoccus sp. TaxID=1872485 RepID=UPI002CA0199D|nr:ABC transporter permease [Amaricoccus sp.]HRW15109.1 ABC transporter permease [Amaricoccus sp.]